MSEYLRWLIDVQGVERMTVHGIAAEVGRRASDVRELLAWEGIAVEPHPDTFSLRDLLASGLCGERVSG